MTATTKRPRPWLVTSDAGAGHPPPKVHEDDLPYVLTPIEPSDPRRSDAAMLLLVYLDAVAGGSSGELALLEVLLSAAEEDFADSPRHRELKAALAIVDLPEAIRRERYRAGVHRLSHAEEAVAAAVHSQLARQAAHAAGLLGDVEHWLHRAGIELSTEGRDLLRLPAKQAMDELVGWEDVEGWHPGRAMLQPQEQNAFRLSQELQGEQDDRGLWTYRLMEPWEIRDRMSRRRGDVREPLPVERVVECLSRARHRVREYLLP